MIFNNLFIFIKRNYWAIIFCCSVLVGLLYVTPQLFIWKELNRRDVSYLTVQYLTNNDEVKGYIPRAREVYDGHIYASDIFEEGKKIVPLNHLPPLIASIPFFLFKGDVNKAYLFLQFLLPGLIFLFFYLLGKVVLGSRPQAVLFAFVGVLTPMARYLPKGFLNVNNFLDIVVKNFVPIVNTKLDRLFLSKIDDPLVTFLIYIPAISALFYFWNRPNKRRAVLFGILIGLLFYTYLHYWVYLLAVFFILSCASWFLMKEDIQFRKSLLVGWGTLSALSIPYVINTILAFRLDTAKDWRGRLGFYEYSHQSNIILLMGHYVFYSIAAIFAYKVLWKNGKKHAALLWWSFLGAMPIVWNIQLITGFNIVADHWFLAFAPISMAMAFYSFFYLFKKIGNKKLVFCFIAIAASLLVVKKTVNVLAFYSPDVSFLKRQDFNANMIDSWKWIDAELPKSSSLVSPSYMTTLFLSMYTSRRAFLPFPFNSFLSTNELEDRFLASNKLFQVSPAVFSARFGNCDRECNELNADFGRGDLKCDKYTRFNLCTSGGLYYVAFRQKEYSTVNNVAPNTDVPVSKIEEMLERYKKMDASFDKMGGKYIYYGPWERELSDIDFRKDKNLNLIYKNSEVSIYKVL